MVLAGSAKANRREPKSCLGRVFKYKLGCFDDVHVFIYVDAQPHLKLKQGTLKGEVSMY